VTSRLPLRVRLVAGFSATMLVVLAAAGAFVYWRVQFALDRGLDSELDQAARTLAPLVATDGTVGDSAAASATGVAWQVVGPDGAVVTHGGPAGTRDLAPRSVLAGASHGEVTADTGRFLPAGDVAYRLHVEPMPGSDDLLVVGVRRDHRDEALRELLGQLALAGLAALVITALVGDRLARAALTPVERYRRRAEEIARGAAGLRLDVPAGRDDEVTRLGNTLNDMLTELERAIERERRFVDEASHELRTPLTLLSSRIQVTRRRTRTVAEHEAALDELATDVARLADLAEELLALGEAESAAGQRAGSTDVHAAAARVAAARDDDRVVDVPPSAGAVPHAAAAATVVDRILTNLVDNALTHGRPPVTILVAGGATDRARWVRLVIEDAGEGMDPELLATATGRFTRAPEARSRPGSGLGLSLVESLVARAGGELRLCHAGHHEHAGGASVDVVCDHGPAMTATVLLPAADDD
jgi:two-component system, OmpR family, sensor kinase